LTYEEPKRFPYALAPPASLAPGPTGNSEAGAGHVPGVRRTGTGGSPSADP
jgi:hypothetical protein